MTPDSLRPIEVESPQKRVLFDAVHGKNVQHGHISTLHRGALSS